MPTATTKVQRIVGVRHRVKQTANGEPRPTQVSLVSPIGVELGRYDLADEQVELAFVYGQYRPRANAKPIGLMAGDVVAMSLGGSGDCLAYALARQGLETGAKVWRLPTYALKQARGEEAAKDEDPALLAGLALEQPTLFHEVGQRDLGVIKVREAWFALENVMKARIGCDQRLRQCAIGLIYTRTGGLYEEGMVERAYDNAKANDAVSQALATEEHQREVELNRALKGLDIYQQLFVPIEGLGPAIAGRLITAIVNIGRFENEHKLKAFCGVHVLPDGSFPRQRRAQVCNWNPLARQALFLLGDQFNRRPGSVWGKRLLTNKAHFRLVHPEEVVENGKKRYTNGHIHKMAIWRTLTQFIEWLYSAWRELDATPTAS